MRLVWLASWCISLADELGWKHGPGQETGPDRTGMYLEVSFEPVGRDFVGQDHVSQSIVQLSQLQLWQRRQLFVKQHFHRMRRFLSRGLQ